MDVEIEWHDQRGEKRSWWSFAYRWRVSVDDTLVLGGSCRHCTVWDVIELAAVVTSCAMAEKQLFTRRKAMREREEILVEIGSAGERWMDLSDWLDHVLLLPPNVSTFWTLADYKRAHSPVDPSNTDFHGRILSPGDTQRSAMGKDMVEP